MKLVLDTNILVSALAFGGKPRTIFEIVITRKDISVFTSKFLVSELLGVLEKKFDYDLDFLQKIELIIRRNFKIIAPDKIPDIIKTDLTDNQVLAVAEKGQVDFIITGDNHLLSLGNFKNTEIITPHHFLARLGN